MCWRGGCANSRFGDGHTCLVNRSNRTQLGYVLVPAQGGRISLNAGVSRIVLDAGMDAWTLSEVRAVRAAIVLGLVVTARRRRFPIRVARHHWPRLVLYGLVGPAGLLQSFYFQASPVSPSALPFSSSSWRRCGSRCGPDSCRSRRSSPSCGRRWR